MSRHKNFVFGKTLELSVTVDGDSVKQELVSSGEDCIVSFKMDSGICLDPKTLREIANFIEGDVGLRLATDQEYLDFTSAAKSNPVLFMSSNLEPSYVFVIAEMLANNEGITLYKERVTEDEENNDDDLDENEYDFDDEDEDEDYDGWANDKEF